MSVQAGGADRTAKRFIFNFGRHALTAFADLSRIQVSILDYFVRLSVQDILPQETLFDSRRLDLLYNQIVLQQRNYIRSSTYIVGALSGAHIPTLCH